MSRIALSALLACATLAVAVPAYAQTSAQDRASGYRVRIDDLDLSSANGAARFDARIERQARTACAGRPTIANLQCRQTLSRELRDALPVQQRQDYARGRTGRVLAMVTTFSA